MTYLFKVLLIEDDIEYQGLVREFLGDKFDLLVCESAESAYSITKVFKPDIILLDIRIPQLDGVSLCQKMRDCAQTQHIPIVMVTASLDVESRVKAFSAGADDFVSKPFTKEELQARVYSKIRRLREMGKKSNVAKCGNLMLDQSKMEAYVGESQLNLTLLEFNLLKYFLMNQNRVLSRKQILKDVWEGCVITDRTIDSHIASIRKKLSQFTHAINTVHGVGFILKERDRSGAKQT